MNSFKRKVNEHHHLNPNDETDMANQQLKNIMKNAQAMMDMLRGGQQLDAWVQSTLAVSDSKIQDIKNYIENEATEAPGEGEAEILMPSIMDFEPETELPAEEPIADELPATVDAPAPEGEDSYDFVGDMEGGDMELPPAFPEDEVDMEADFEDEEGEGSSVIDVETRYGKK